jgi:hypothetical protein
MLRRLCPLLLRRAGRSYSKFVNYETEQPPSDSKISPSKVSAPLSQSSSTLRPRTRNITTHTPSTRSRSRTRTTSGRANERDSRISPVSPTVPSNPLRVVVDSYYYYLVRSEFYWPAIFGLGYAAMEPDVWHFGKFLSPTSTTRGRRDHWDRSSEENMRCEGIRRERNAASPASCASRSVRHGPSQSSPNQDLTAPDVPRCTT